MREAGVSDTGYRGERSMKDEFLSLSPFTDCPRKSEIGNLAFAWTSSPWLRVSVVSLLVERLRLD